jgi:hypothetical protein
VTVWRANDGGCGHENPVVLWCSTGNVDKRSCQTNESGDAMTARKAIPKRLRFEILRRDNHACRYCGAMAPDAVIQVDHVIPVSLGGTDEPSNLVAACKDCNAGKSSVPLGADVIEDVDRRAREWAAAREEVMRSLRREGTAMDDLCDGFNAHWKSYTYGDSGRTVPRDEQWRQSVIHWAKRGMTLEDLEVIVDSVMAAKDIRDRWRYFCKIVWNTIKEIDDQTEANYRQRTAPEPDVFEVDVFGNTSRRSGGPTVIGDALKELFGGAS